MTRQNTNLNAPADLINVTSTANSRRGDPLRTAFIKINDAFDRADANFVELYASLGGGGNGTSVVTGSTAPSSPSVGDLWYDTISGRTYIYYDSNWVDANPVDGAGINSTNELVNGVHTVSLNSTGKVSLPTNLTIDAGVIGKSSTNVISEETVSGTISETTEIESQIEIETTGIVIAKRIRLTVDDTVTTSVDEVGSTLTVNNAGAVLKHYTEPDGPNNSAYFQIGTSNAGAVIEGVEENVGSNIYGRVTAAQGVVHIATGVDAVNNDWVFDVDGILTLPYNNYLETIDTNLQIGSQGVVTIRSDAASSTTTKAWAFDKSGTINTPLMLPLTFTAVLDSAHKTGAALTLTDTPWEFTVQFQVNPNGTVETMMNSIFPNLVNPGYTTADQFSFTEADHGIPGYTFELELDNLVLAGPAGWTASPVVSIPPEYPSTVKSLGAIKLTANDQNLVFGTDGRLTLPDALYVTTGLDGAIIGTNGVVVKAKNANPLSLEWSLNDEENIYAENPALNTVTASLAFGLNGVNIEVNNPDNGGSWTFGPDGKLSVPGPIFRDGGLYMNSSGSTTAASVFVNGFGGSVILRTANNADQVSYDLTFDVNGETSFPGRLNFSDGSTLGDNILTGAVDSDLGLEVKRTITVSDVAAAGSTTGTLIVDISENDDITVVAPGWEINAGSEIAPQWMMVTVITFNPDNTRFEITVDGFVFEPGNTYTFRNPVPESNIWVIRSQTGGILGPGGAIITNETAALGGGLTYRELAIELPTPDGLNEQRWVFDNDGTLESPAGGTINTSRLDANNLNASYINYQTNDPIQIGAGNGSRFTVNMGRFQVLADVPLTSVGSDGDVVGCVAFDATYIYYCTGLYNGVSHIWKRVALSNDTW